MRQFYNLLTSPADAFSRGLGLWVLRGLKLLLFSGFLWLLYSQVERHISSYDLVEVIWKDLSARLTLLAVVVLMLANWTTETIKWRMIVSQFDRISMGSAGRSVLSGVSLAIITPGRIGEYGGRLVGIHPSHRSKALLANGVSSIAQNVANISIGLMGMVGYGIVFLDMNRSTVVALIGITLVILIVLVTLFYRLDVVSHVLGRFTDHRWVQYLSKQSTFLAEYSGTKLTQILALSYLRYGIYVLQYVMLVLLCGVTSDVYFAILGVTVIFFIQSGIPLPPMLSVLARGEMAIWIWSVFSANVMAILTATFLLWFINLVIPAIAGAIVLWTSSESLISDHE